MCAILISNIDSCGSLYYYLYVCYINKYTSNYVIDIVNKTIHNVNDVVFPFYMVLLKVFFFLLFFNMAAMINPS